MALFVAVALKRYHGKVWGKEKVGQLHRGNHTWTRSNSPGRSLDHGQQLQRNPCFMNSRHKLFQVNRAV